MKLESLECISEDIDIDEYIDFREMIKQHMEHPEWLGDFSKDDLINMLNNNSKIWIFYINSEAVCSMMFIPCDENALNKFGLDLDFREVASYGAMFVNPKYFGNNLQYQMLKFIDDYAINNGYKYAVGTIHPDNIYSINNFVRDKFALVDTKNFKRGVRNIYFKKI